MDRIENGRQRPGRAARAGLGVALVAMLAAPLGLAPAGAAVASPSLELIVPSSDVTMYRYNGGPTPLDLGLLVAAVDGPLEFRVRRASYTDPLTIEQVLHANGVTQTRTLDPELLDGWYGLDDFLDVTFFDATGSEVVSTSLTFCPNSPQRQRANDSGPADPTYPWGCFANPFTKGMVWGVDKGWANSVADPYGSRATLVDIPNGEYRVRAAISDTYVELFDIDPAETTVELNVTVKGMKDGCDPRGCEGPIGHDHASHSHDVEGQWSSDRSATLTSAPVIEPDPSILPDLVALPSWGINVQNRGDRSKLFFGATVWVQGASDLVVEGFRREAQATMDAYQYFYRDGEMIGKAPAGELEFDDKDGHEHWHFKQFAGYSLVDADGGKVRLSRKEAFCLAPTDAVDITLPGARLNPALGLGTACGAKESIWIRETLPLGWGDTYFQSLPGQSFNITNMPNGTYYIKVEANPGGMLYEQTADNNTELREIILRGKPGARKVIVPPWNGIDSEGRNRAEVVRSASEADGRLAFIRNHHNGMTDVASLAPDGRNLVKVTDSKPNELYVDVSPDGRRVAFTRFGGNGGEIYTASISGGNLKRLTKDKVNDELPIWSPDSSQIAFVRYPKGEGDSEIFVMNRDGSGRQRITSNKSGDADPRWSPDGTKLIYNGGSIDRNAQDVFVVTLGETGATRLTEPGINDSFAEWSPDGLSVVYSSYRDDQWDIYKVGLDGVGPVRLTDDPVDDFAPEWSPDGTQLSFVRGRLEGNLPADEVYVMQADGSSQRSLSPARLQAFSPEWAPSGSRIAFIGQVQEDPDELPEWDIFAAAVDGSGLERLTNTAAEEFDPEWGPPAR